MRPIVFFQRSPRQVDAPLFRALTARGIDLSVVFRQVEQPFDPEVGLAPNFGDVTAGYKWVLGRINLPSKAHVVVEGWHYPWALQAAMTTSLMRGRTLGVRFDNVAHTTSRLIGTLSRVRTRAALAMADVWHPSSTASLAYARELSAVHIRPHVAIPYVSDELLFRRESLRADQTQGRLRALVVAKLNEREGVEDVIRAVGSMDNWSLTVVGDGPDRRSLEELSGHVGARATFVGYVPYQELPHHFSTSDLFIHAAHEEPWGVSVQEAMLSGVPVVASSKVGAAQELIAAPSAEWCYEPGDITNLRGLLRGMESVTRRREHAESNSISVKKVSPVCVAYRIADFLSRG